MSICTNSFIDIKKSWENELVAHLLNKSKTIVNHDLKKQGVGDNIKDFSLFSSELKSLISDFEVTLPAIVSFEINSRKDVEYYLDSFYLKQCLPRYLHENLGLEIGKIGSLFRKYGATYTPSFGSRQDVSFFLCDKDSTYFNRYNEELRNQQMGLLNALKLWLKENPEKTIQIDFN
ncbi:hypothetical protein [Photobacterium kishitanii]|uniref:hypothetical protein n=1 Tax=Photobacterium kishitanii TaxID=318456 RepID=UPI000D17CA7E|nr:hypothetical protein [Photobacterium kishitanii]PSV14407.1 hypothetical protein C0W28_16880 [Photobacterium kishitanii]